MGVDVRKEGPAAPREFIISSVSMYVYQVFIRESRVLSKRRCHSDALIGRAFFHQNAFIVIRNSI